MVLRPGVGYGLEVRWVGPVPALEGVLRLALGLKGIVTCYFKNQYPLCCSIGKWYDLCPPPSCLSSAPNLTTKWISLCTAPTKEDISGSAPSGEMSPWSAICNANRPALASKIDVPCKKVLSCWTGAEWERPGSLPSLEWVSAVTRQGWGRGEPEPFCTVHYQSAVVMHLNSVGASKSGLKADGMSELGQRARRLLQTILEMGEKAQSPSVSEQLRVVSGGLQARTRVP